MESEHKLENYTFVGVSGDQQVIFDNTEPRLVLIDILQPVVKLEDCVWLREE